MCDGREHLAEAEARLERLVAKLRGRNARMTQQRLALLRLLVSSTNHPSAAQLYDQLREQFPSASLATVYKTLNLLEEMDEVLELGFSHDDRRYDGSRPYPHPHLVCIRCRKIVDAPDQGAEGVVREAAERAGFAVIGLRLDVVGLCPECQSARQEHGCAADRTGAAEQPAALN